MYSAGLRNWLTEWAIQMSRLRKARLTSTKASRITAGVNHPGRELLLAMGPPHFLGHRLDLDGVLQHGVVAVPLGEVLAAHERPVLGGPPVVVPQVEVIEVDGLLERFGAQD